MNLPGYLIMVANLACSDKKNFICPFLHIDECNPHMIESARHEPNR